jgi:GNAT superfamily N-acetyltransferase
MINIVQISSNEQSLSLAWSIRLNMLNRRWFNFPRYMIDCATWWWVAMEGHSLIGFAGSTAETSSDIFLGPCGILPDYRGRGLQRTFILIREETAKAHGYRRAVSFTDADNYASANNFIRSGYTLGPPWKPFENPEYSLFWRKLLK